jgi:hypothetical protein
MTYPPQQPEPHQPAQPPQWPTAQQTPTGYAHQQPPVQYPTPPSQSVPQAPKRRPTGLIIAGAVAVVLVMAGVGVGVFALRGVGPFKDSGVAMCEQMRDSQAKGTQAKIPGSTSSDGKWDIDTYHKVRKQFADSRYTDLRDAGTKLIDLAWQLFGMTSNSNSDGALGAALMMGGQIMQDYSSLAGACANHGVDIPNKLGS